jgi:hypothetical protein
MGKIDDIIEDIYEVLEKMFELTDEAECDFEIMSDTVWEKYFEPFYSYSKDIERLVGKL